MVMKRPKPFHIHSGTIKSALHPLKPYIVATIGCAIVAWVLFNLSQKAEPDASAYLWLQALAEAFVWVTVSGTICNAVLFTIYLLQDARTARETEEPSSRR